MIASRASLPPERRRMPMAAARVLRPHSLPRHQPVPIAAAALAGELTPPRYPCSRSFFLFRPSANQTLVGRRLQSNNPLVVRRQAPFPRRRDTVYILPVAGSGIATIGEAPLPFSSSLYVLVIV